MADETTQGTDPFDAQLEALQRMLSGGGGIGSDARMPVARVPFDPAVERQIKARTTRGLDPTPDQVAYLKAIMPEKEAIGNRWASVGHELTMIPQAMRAGTAIGEAYQDPSLANVTNAGMQTAFTALRPQAAAVIGGAGYATALAKDLGLFSGSPAEAQAKKQQAPKQLLPGLDAAQQAALDAAEKKLLAEDYDGPAGRKQLKDTVDDLRGISRAYATEKNRLKLGAENADELAKQAEYNRAVGESEAAFQEEMARNKSFDKTDIGKMYEKTGGYAPFIAGTVGGTLTRLGAGPGSATTKYIAPAIMGGAAGFIAPNAPNYYNATHTPADNPKKRAYEARGEALPPGHPRKQEFLDYAKTLPEENPVHEGALRDYTTENILKRGTMGAAEGVVGGLGGADIVNALGRTGSATGGIISWLRSLGGRSVLPGGPQSPSTTSGTSPAGTPSGANALLPTSTAGAASSEPIPPGSAIERNVLAGESAQLLTRQGRLPAPAATSNRPTWASDPPEGVKIDKGYYWDASIGQQRHEKGGFGPAAKYSAPRIPREGSASKSPRVEEERSVQIDDMQPYGFRRNSLDPGD